MSHTPVEPVRLADLPPEQDMVGVSPLVRAAGVPLPELTPTARQRIRNQLYGSLTGHERARPRRLRVAVALSLTLALGGVVGAATHSAIVRRLSSPHPDTPLRETNGGHHRSARPSRPVTEGSAAVENPPALPVPVVEPPSELPRAEMPKFLAPAPAVSRRTPGEPPLVVRSVALSPRTSLEPPPSHTPVPLPPPPPPSEAAVLAEAIRKLRVDRDAASALNFLDGHRAFFSTSGLFPEASALRIEALLKLGHRSAALLDLDHLALGSVPRRAEWQVVRGELRATAGRWLDAEADFAAVLTGVSGEASGELTERALWGRAVARSRRGDVASARTDCKEYLRRFPAGRFAGQASQALLSSPSR